MPAAIRVEGLGKRYRLAQGGQRAGYRTLRESLVGAAAAPFRRRGNTAGIPTSEEFWALSDVGFEVQPGEVVGIIGRNGAGKSTLLKILSRITKPTTGRVEISGRVGSLLEVGTGFHPELTGRENVYLNGSILGMSRREIDKKFDEIVAFAEVEKFLDTPVKRYSSGMYVRLAFAVAAHLEPEILIVDEVLAVGDHHFQRKCLGKMSAISRAGRTVLFVSHNMPAVRSLCNRGIVLDAGKVVCAGDVEQCLGFYSRDSAEDDRGWTRRPNRPPAPLSFISIDSEVQGRQPNLTLITRLILRSNSHHGSAFVALDLADSAGGVLMQSVPVPNPFIPAWTGNPVTHEVTVVTQLPPLIPGEYSVSAWCGTHYTETVEMIDTAVWFRVTESPTQGRSYPFTPEHGRIAAVASATHHIVPATSA